MKNISQMVVEIKIRTNKPDTFKPRMWVAGRLIALAALVAPGTFKIDVVQANKPPAKLQLYKFAGGGKQINIVATSMEEAKRVLDQCNPIGNNHFAESVAPVHNCRCQLVDCK